MPPRHGPASKGRRAAGVLDVAVKLLAVARKNQCSARCEGGSPVSGPVWPIPGLSSHHTSCFIRHFSGVPVGNIALVHLESVVMLCHGDHIRAPASRKSSATRQDRSVPHGTGDKVLVAEVLVGACRFHVVLDSGEPWRYMFPRGTTLLKAGTGIGAPVDKMPILPWQTIPAPGGKAGCPNRPGKDLQAMTC